MNDITLSQDVAVSESGFMFLPSTGECFTVNATGRCIIAALQQGKTETETLRLLTSEFEIDERTAERDLREFVSQLQRYHLTKPQSPK
jgi:hypothetical protein